MKSRFLLLLLIAVAFSVVGCSNQTDSNKVESPNISYGSKALIIEKNNGNDNYVKLKIISDKETINNISTVLDNAHWEDASVSMTHPPDFKINNLYDIWIGPQKNFLEVVIEGKNKYAKLSEKDSNTLFKIMTGKELVKS